MDHLHRITIESRAFLDAAAAGPLDEPVPSCPGWTVRDLVGHLGVVQQFHGSHLGRGVSDPPVGDRPSPPGDDTLLDWFAAGTQRLLAELRHVGTQAPAWNFLGAEPATTAFWHRRLAHEATIHRWDVQHARGGTRPLDPADAVDGVDEVLDTWAPARWGRGHQGSLDARFEFDLVDVDAHRTTTFGAGSRSVTVAGTAGDVLLALWGRLPVRDRRVAGDEDLLSAITMP